MKVYAVSSGEDYNTIEAIFSTEEKRNQFLKPFKGMGIYHKDEFELDELPARHLPAWQAEISLTDGKLVGRVYGFASDRHLAEQKVPSHLRNAFGISTKSKRHAIKLAVEARQQWLREQARQENP